jgi:putative ABC transport system permease protein
LIQYYKRDLEGNLLQKDDEIMIGKAAAEIGAIKIGDTVSLFGKNFTVVGIFRSGVGWEQSAGVVHISFVEKQRKLAPGSTTMLFVYLDGTREKKEVAAEIARSIPRLKAVGTEDILEHFAQQIVYVDYFVWVVSVAALAV